MCICNHIAGLVSRSNTLRRNRGSYTSIPGGYTSRVINWNTEPMCRLDGNGCSCCSSSKHTSMYTFYNFSTNWGFDLMQQNALREKNREGALFASCVSTVTEEAALRWHLCCWVRLSTMGSRWSSYGARQTLANSHFLVVHMIVLQRLGTLSKNA